MRATTSEKIFFGFNYIILSLIALSCLLPMINILAVSFSNFDAVSAGKVGLFPIGWNLNAYELLFAGSPVVTAFLNSVIITVVGTFLNMLFTIMAAYPLSKSYFIGRRFYTLAIIFTMLFGGGMIPAYLLVKALGLINTYGSLWLPGLVAVWNLLILRTFFTNIPGELEEAARIDGCSEWRLIWKIFLPLSLPVVATLTLFYAVGHWNAFMNVLIYINDTDKYNMSVLVQKMIQSANLLNSQDLGNLNPEDIVSIPPEGVKSAGIIIMVAPMLMLYPFLQKYFVKGVMMGSVKG